MEGRETGTTADKGAPVRNANYVVNSQWILLGSSLIFKLKASHFSTERLLWIMSLSEFQNNATKPKNEFANQDYQQIIF